LEKRSLVFGLRGEDFQADIPDFWKGNPQVLGWLLKENSIVRLSLGPTEQPTDPYANPRKNEPVVTPPAKCWNW
jgi:hypothetical protein